MASTSIEITDKALKKISRELIDDRSLDTTKFEVIGNLKVSNKGVASPFSPSSYIKCDDVELSNEKSSTTIIFKGLFSPIISNGLEIPQVAFVLKRSSTSMDNIELQVTSSSIKLFVSDELKIAMTNLSLSEENIRVQVELGKDPGLLLITEKTSKEVKAPTNTVFPELSNYKIINIGANFGSDLYWAGNINLPSFTILENSSIAFSLGTSNTFNISEILVSDGTEELTDTSTEKTGHIYSGEIKSIKRNNNNIFISANIDSSVHMTIKEIGIYSHGDDGRILFAHRDGLSLNKAENASYGIVLSFSTNINILNVDKDINIDVKDEKEVDKRDFLSVKNVYSNSIANVERVVRSNALGRGKYVESNIESGEVVSNEFGIGDYKVHSEETNKGQILKKDPNLTDSLPYDSYVSNSLIGVGHQRDQIYYKEYQDISLSKDNFTALSSYNKLMGRFCPTTYFYFDPSSIEKEGTVTCLADGQTTFETASSRASVKSFEVDQNEWSIEGHFKSPLDAAPKQTILEFGADTKKVPLELFIEDKKCKLIINEQEKAILKSSLDNKSYIYVNSNKIETSNSEGASLDMYSWTLDNGADFSLPNLQIVGDVEYSTDKRAENFSIANYMATTNSPFSKIFNINSTWEINFKLETSQDVKTKQNILATSNINIGIENSKLFGSFIDSASTEHLGECELSLKSNSSYYVTVKFNSDSKIEMSVEEESSGLESNKTVNLSENSYILPTSEMFVGVSALKESPFLGVLLMSTFNIYIEDYMWSSVRDLKTICSNTADPTSETAFYTVEGDPIPEFSFQTLLSNNILEQELFKITPFLDYSFKIEFNGTGYYITYYANYKLIENKKLLKSSSYKVNKINKIFLGNGTQKSSRFKGVLYLYDFRIISKNEEFNLRAKKEVITQIKDYFHFSECPYSLYYISNLGSTDTDVNNNRIKVLEDVVTGEFDNIDFSNSNGFTLIFNVHLKNLKDKLIVTKRNKEGDEYFRLSIEDETLIFRLNNIIIDEQGYQVYDRPIILKKEISLTEVKEYTENIITLIITYTGSPVSPTYCMFKNSTLLDEYTAESTKFPDITYYYLANYLPDAITGEELTDEAGLYLKDIIAIEGDLSNEEENLFLISSILGTNF